MLTEEQKKERLNYITGSDTSAILGVNPWKTSFDVWREKLGYVEAEDISDKPAVKAGNMLEPSIRDWFRHDTGKVVEEPEMLVSKDYPWLAGNLDGWIPEEQAVLEIKTAGSDKKWGEPGENIIPAHYLCQVVHYCLITNSSKAYVAALFNGVDFRIYTPHVSQALKDKIILRTDKFWNYHVKEQVPPEPANYEEVKQIFPTPKAAGVEASPKIIGDMQAFLHVKQKIKELEQHEKNYKDKIAVYMGENESILDADGRPLATFKQDKSKMSFDKKKFEKENPELCKQYMIESDGARRLLVKKRVNDE